MTVRSPGHRGLGKPSLTCSNSLRTANQRKMPGLTAWQLSDGRWVIISDDRTKPLTKIEVNKIIATYLALAHVKS